MRSPEIVTVLRLLIAEIRTHNANYQHSTSVELIMRAEKAAADFSFLMDKFRRAVDEVRRYS